MTEGREAFGTAVWFFSDWRERNENVLQYRARMAAEAPAARKAFVEQLVGARIVSVEVDCSRDSNNPDAQLIDRIVLDNGCVLTVGGCGEYDDCGEVAIEHETDPE